MKEKKEERLVRGKQGRLQSKMKGGKEGGKVEKRDI